MKPFIIEAPIEVSFVDSILRRCGCPFVERINGQRVTFMAEDFHQAFELSNGLHFPAGTVG